MLVDNKVMITAPSKGGRSSVSGASSVWEQALTPSVMS